MKLLILRGTKKMVIILQIMDEQPNLLMLVLLILLNGLVLERKLMECGVGLLLLKYGLHSLKMD